MFDFWVTSRGQASFPELGEVVVSGFVKMHLGGWQLFSRSGRKRRVVFCPPDKMIHAVDHQVPRDRPVDASSARRTRHPSKRVLVEADTDADRLYVDLARDAGQPR